MDDDDRMIGRILSRREALAALAGTGAAALLAGCAPVFLREYTPTDEAMLATSDIPGRMDPATGTAQPTGVLPACVVRPELTEGPFFVDERLNRADIRTDPSSGEQKQGALLDLSFRVSRVGSEGCTPLEGASVDVWHCDALGLYSGVRGPGFDTRQELFLRGYQVTDRDGLARFRTIYPGWYPGRAVHIHFKIRGELSTASGYEFTSQLFFAEAANDLFLAGEPYSGRNVRRLLNQEDGIFQRGGSQLLLDVRESQAGLAGLFDIGLVVS